MLNDDFFFHRLKNYPPFVNEDIFSEIYRYNSVFVYFDFDKSCSKWWWLNNQHDEHNNFIHLQGKNQLFHDCVVNLFLLCKDFFSLLLKRFHFFLFEQKKEHPRVICWKLCIFLYTKTWLIFGSSFMHVKMTLKFPSSRIESKENILALKYNTERSIKFVYDRPPHMDAFSI